MNTKMIVEDEGHWSATAMVLLLVGAMALASALVLSLAWSGPAEIENVESEAAPALEIEGREARYYTERYAETAAAREAAANVVEMERYQEAIAGEREFTYTTAEAVEEGRRAAEAYWRARESEPTLLFMRCNGQSDEAGLRCSVWEP